jgi:hypothetical protein
MSLNPSVAYTNIMKKVGGGCPQSHQGVPRSLRTDLRLWGGLSPHRSIDFPLLRRAFRGRSSLFNDNDE